MPKPSPLLPGTAHIPSPDRPGVSSNPDRSTFADRVIARLRFHHQQRAEAREAPAFDDTFAHAARPSNAARGAGSSKKGATPAAPLSVLTQLSQSPSLRHLAPDDWNAIVAQGGDPFATTSDGRSLPSVDVPLSELLLTLRLVATFGSEGGFAEHLEPGALTVLSGLDWPDRSLLEHVLRHAILPDGWDANSRAVKIGTGPCLRLFTDTARDEVLREALGERAPLLFALADDDKFAQSFSTVSSQHLTLAPITRELLLVLLAASHSATGRIDEAAVRAALPSEDALARLTPEQVLIAARAPTARAAAERIACFAAESATVIVPANAHVPSLQDMASRSPAHQSAWRIVLDLVAWQNGEVSWNDLTRSMLLHGAPGTGKTMLARAMGESAGISFISASFAEWQSAGHLGQMLAAMRKTFNSAREAAPCVLFIDEIDAAGSRADGDRLGRDYRTQVINGFLEEVDRISREPGVVLVGACNYPDRLDPAILRAGRFDLKIELPLPDRRFLEAMLREALGDTLSPTEIAQLARDAVGQTPADLDAAIRAARADARHLAVPVDAPLLRHHLGTDAINPASLHRIAVHEAGHAIAAHHYDAGSVRRIQVSDRAGGVDRQPPPADMLLSDLEAEITIQLAGRAAEEVILGMPSNGAGGTTGSDLAKATYLAAAIEHRYGLGHEGLLWTETLLPGFSAPPELRARLRKRLEIAARRARDLIRQYQTTVNALAARIEADREMTGDELQAFFLSTATVATGAPVEAPPLPLPPEFPENSLLE